MFCCSFNPSWLPPWILGGPSTLDGRTGTEDWVEWFVENGWKTSAIHTTIILATVYCNSTWGSFKFWERSWETVWIIELRWPYGLFILDSIQIRRLHVLLIFNSAIAVWLVCQDYLLQLVIAGRKAKRNAKAAAFSVVLEPNSRAISHFFFSCSINH